MATGNLKSALRHRLKPRRNKRFVALVKERYPNFELHHIIESRLGGRKLNDFLQPEEEFLDDFIKSLEIVFDILEELLK